jgi:cytochrome b561
MRAAVLPTPAPARYTAVAIVLHWLIALGIVCQLALGLLMTQVALKQMTLFKLYQLHKSVGITVLLLVLLRVLWRLGHRPPPLPASLPAIERRAAHGTHWALYLFMLGVPLTGWAMVSSSPYNLPTVLFGTIPWPDLPILSTLTDKAPVEAAFKLVHNYAAWVLIPVLVVHAAAALRHHFVKRDAVLWRMLPLVSRRPV